MPSNSKFPSPTRGASLLLSFRLNSRTVVIVGCGKLAATRAFSFLESEAHVVVLARGGLDCACEEVRWRVDRGEIEWRSVEKEADLWRASTSDFPQKAVMDGEEEEEEEEAALRSVLSSLPSVSLVCITDTIISSASTTKCVQRRSAASATRLYNISSRAYRIPTNTTDMPSLCDFSFPSTHRFRGQRTGELTSLQIGVVTNSKGCRLSSRITREIVARLPTGVGDAVDNVGRLREKAKAENTSVPANNGAFSLEEECEVVPTTPNEPVPQRVITRGRLSGHEDETLVSRTQRRMRWTAQVSEYWPLQSLASLNDEDIDQILNGSSTLIPRALVAEEPSVPQSMALSPARSHHSLGPLIAPPSLSSCGRIFLVGSGPGHPSLLTLATSRVLEIANLVLSDKLVPEAVLRVIPKHVELRIARKFPGNSDQAQQELIHAALEAAQQGKTVVRLKQGDPMLYARVSSEIEYFTAHGFPPTVVPGLSSAFAAPLAAGIPITARGVAEGVAICTGVGKGGKGGRVPPYNRGTTVLVLMGVARLPEIVCGMTTADSYPGYLPTCIIERGTMPDQRVVSSTLDGIVDAMGDPRVGAQRPPGMMVVGWACLGVAEGVEGVSDDEGEGLEERDLERVNRWLNGERFTVKEGLDKSWEGI